MAKINKKKNLILISLLITGLVVFAFSTLSVRADEGETQEPVCGDGNLDDGEECDDGGNNGIECIPDYGSSCNYCSSGCQIVELTGSYCGDGNLDDIEECDDGENNGIECTPEYGSACNYCSINCQTIEIAGAYCGDGNVDEGEECDDGNNEDGDSCLADCTIEGELSPEPECSVEETQPCETGLLGICAAGTQTCGEDGFWSDCLQDQEATEELCDNGFDDDCDGDIDCADADCNEDPTCPQTSSEEDGEDSDCEEGADCEDSEEIIEEGECEEDDCQINIVSDNEAEVENDVVEFGSTGDNQIEVSQDDSEEEEDDPSINVINTGNVNIVVGLFNIINSNVINSAFQEFLLNIFETLEEDINLSDEISDETEESPEESCASSTDCLNLNVVSDNQGSIENDVLVGASTGGNSIDAEDGEAIIKTGNANVVANVFNILNSNIIGLNWTRFIINIFGNWIGDLTFPRDEVMQEFIESDSSGCGENCEDSNIVSSNEGQIENEVLVVADTGQNTITGGSGVIETGDANVQTEVSNIANSNVNGGNWFFIAINNFGEWKGNVYGLPPGLGMDKDSGSVKIYNLSPDELNSQSTASNSLNIVENNSGSIKNSVIINVLTGNNSANSTSATIETGDANAVANLVNILNSNITGVNWLSGMINVFGTWEGDLNFGQSDCWIGESAITSPNPPKLGGAITYTLTYFNNGDIPATGVTIIDDFDERYLSITDPGGGTVIDNPGEIQWNIGTVPAGGSGSVSYSAVIDSSSSPGKDYYVTNVSEINSLEEDRNYEDNTDSISILVSPIDWWQPPKPILPDLRIAKTHKGDEFIYPGSYVDYQIVLTNVGNGSAYDVVVEDILLNESSEEFSTSTWDLGEVLAGEEIIIDYTVAIGSEVPAGLYTNTARAAGKDHWGDIIDSPQVSNTIEIKSLETSEEETEEEEEEISLEEIENKLEEIENKIEKIREEIERITPETPIETFIGALQENLIPEVLAQEELSSIFEELEEKPTNEGLEKFLAAAGFLFNSGSPIWVLIIVLILLLINYFIQKREKEIRLKNLK
jgi:uncharacterized repeat protein (TIGR01451 family)